MAFLGSLGAALGKVPNPVWAAVHLVTALVGLWFAFKAKENKLLMWGFILYAIPALLYTFVHYSLVDSYATHILESVLVFIAVILFGVATTQK